MKYAASVKENKMKVETKKLSYRRQRARQLRMSFYAR